MTSLQGEFRWPVRVYWEDTDAGGIVFYANYLKFFERSRTEWLRTLGVEQQRLRDSTGGMFVVAETSIRYLRPARLDDELIVTARLLEMGHASLIIGQQALLKSEQPPSGDSADLPGREGLPQAGSVPSGASVAREASSAGATLLCEGRIRIGWVDACTMRPARLPAAIVSRLRSPT